MSALDSRLAYANFRAWVPRKAVPVGVVEPQEWVYYDWGPRSYGEPLLCIHDTVGAAEAFYPQILSLAPLGYRVLSVSIPIYWSVGSFCDGLRLFLEAVRVRRVHLYGAGLGGFLALAFAARRPEATGSLVLTHAYARPERARRRLPQSPEVLRWLPEFAVRGAVRELCPRGRAEATVARAAEFLMTRTFRHSKTALLARLALSVAPSVVAGRVRLPDDRLTLLDTLDRPAPPAAAEAAAELLQLFPGARVAQLKTGGDFPYLSRPEEVNMHLVVHLRRHAPAPAEPLPLPPPAQVVPAEPRERETQPSKAPKTGAEDLQAKARAAAKADERARLEKYADGVAKLREILPERSEAFLAAVLEDNGGDLETAVTRTLDGKYPSNYDRKIFDRAVCAAAAEARLAADKKKQHPRVDSEQKPAAAGASAKSDTADPLSPPSVASHPPAHAVPNPASALPSSGSPRRSTAATPVKSSGGRSRGRRPRQSGLGRSYDEETDKLTAYLTSGKPSRRDTALVGRGPVPYASSPRLRSPTTTPEKEDDRGSDAMSGDGPKVDTISAQNEHSKVGREDSALDGGEMGGTKGGDSVDDGQSRAHDEWREFRQAKADPLLRVGESADRAKEAEKEEGNDERMREWTMAATSAIDRR